MQKSQQTPQKTRPHSKGTKTCPQRQSATTKARNRDRAGKIGAKRPRNSMTKIDLYPKWRDQDGRCCWCGRDTLYLDRQYGRIWFTPNPPEDNIQKRTATREHIIPVSKGGSNYPKNILCACTECNHKRGDNEDALELHPTLAHLVKK